MKRKVIVLQGIPASGKSTWAKTWVEENKEHRVRFNRDDIRNMLGSYWVPSREGLINAIYHSFLNEAMLGGYDIVIDNMNLNQKTIAEIESRVKSFNEWIKQFPMDLEYEIEYHFFNTPLEECIRRDSLRDNPIGEETIRKIYEKYSNVIENGKL